MNPNQKTTLIAAAGLHKSFGGECVVHDVSLQVSAGNVVTIIGPNGSGKTTLLRLLLGLENPDSGTITRSPGLRIGYMPQKMVIDPTLSMPVEWFLRTHGHAHITREQVDDIAAETGITRIMQHPMHRVSGGELQRVMLARALLCAPELLVLDEPVQGVDIHGQAQLYALIARIAAARHCGVLMVSHDLHMVMSTTNEVLCLNRHICCAGHPRQVSNDPAFIALFGAPMAASLAVYTHQHDHAHEESHPHFHHATHTSPHAH